MDFIKGYQISLKQLIRGKNSASSTRPQNTKKYAANPQKFWYIIIEACRVKTLELYSFENENVRRLSAGD